jgi:hypothetical protein
MGAANDLLCANISYQLNSVAMTARSGKWEARGSPMMCMGEGTLP